MDKQFKENNVRGMRKEFDINFQPSTLTVINEELKKAITERSIAGILQVYDYVEELIDLDNAPEKDFEEYNKLVDQANGILYK